MAFLKTSQDPTLLENVGNFLPIAFGIATASGTTLTVTVPQLRRVFMAIGTSQSTATSPFHATTDTTIQNKFTMTVGSGEVIAWMAIGEPRA